MSAKDIDAIIGVGVAELTDLSPEYYEVAGTLSDRGFGSFERCLHILSVCGGNQKEAEKILSKLMMKENK